MAKAKGKTGKETGPMIIEVTLGDLVQSQNAMAMLGSMTLIGKTSYWIGKAIGKASKEVDNFNEGVLKIIKDNGGKPSKRGGLELDPKAPNYDKTWRMLDTHRKSVQSEIVTLTGVKTVTFTELTEALPDRRDKEGEITDEKEGLQPFILAALDWLITE